MTRRIFDTDGKVAGSIHREGSGWLARDPDGRSLGTHESEVAAVHAVLKGHTIESARRDARSDELLARALDEMSGRWRAEARRQERLAEVEEADA